MTLGSVLKDSTCRLLCMRMYAQQRGTAAHDVNMGSVIIIR